MKEVGEMIRTWSYEIDINLKSFQTMIAMYTLACMLGWLIYR